MATYRKTKAGKWRCDVKRNAVRRSRTFKSKNEAMLWGIEQEKLFEDADGDYIPGYTLADCFERYGKEVSPKKAGERWETVRLRKLARNAYLGPIVAHDLRKADIERWIEESLREVSPATVNRELNLIQSVVKKSVDWKWIPVYPLTGIERPKKTPPRRRRISQPEIDAICSALDVDQANIVVERRIHQVAVIFLFAIESACRLSEVCGLTWDNVYLSKRYVHLPKSKNGDSRDVPLTRRACELLASAGTDQGEVFTVGGGTASTFFTRYCKKAGVTNLHFHDARHEAITRLAKTFSMLELARIVGHRDPRSLMIYYEPTAEELASKLD